MAENTAKVIKMNLPPDDGNDGNAPADASGGGGSTARPKRKKKFDHGKLQTLFRRWALQFCSQIAWDTETRSAYSIAGLRNQYGNDEVRMWMQSDKRRDVRAEQVVFDPSGKCGPECINLYGGLEVVPVAGNYTPITELLYHLVDLDEVVYDWILDWIAYPLQNPGGKMPTSVIMHGDEGSGKNLFWEIVQSIYGDYGSVVGQDQLEDKFNDYLSRKLFIIGDEVLSRQEMRHLKGKLKAMISGKTIQINTKMMPVRTEANHVNLVFLSNEIQPNAVDASDRRYCVVWTPPKLDEAYYQAVVACRDKGGKEAFYDMLLKRDLSAFLPYSPPPMTKAKTDLTDLGRPNPERWLLAWREGLLPVSYAPCSADQAYRFYRRWCAAEGEKFPMSKIVFARMVMREARQSIQVKPCKLRATGTVTRMWFTEPTPPEVDMGALAQDKVDLFESQLRGYIGEN